jgi:hypothetical protein
MNGCTTKVRAKNGSNEKHERERLFSDDVGRHDKARIGVFAQFPLLVCAVRCVSMLVVDRTRLTCSSDKRTRKINVVVRCVRCVDPSDSGHIR